MQDASTIAYIGEFYSAATQVSLPLLNEAGVPMISPSSTAKGLTVDGPGTARRAGARTTRRATRNFFRLVPNDAVQARRPRHRDARQGLQDDRRAPRRATLYGRGLAADIRASAKRLGLKVAG